MVKKTRPNNANLGQIVTRIQHQMKNLGEASYCHVLKENNGMVDDLANKACHRPQGEAKINEKILLKHIP